MTFNTKSLIFIAVVIALILVAGATLYINQNKTGVLSREEAGKIAIDFINQAIQEDVTASLVEVSEESGVYKIDLQVKENPYTSYITKDGKILFSQGFAVEEASQ